LVQAVLLVQRLHLERVSMGQTQHFIQLPQQVAVEEMLLVVV
jgi:hypothetical protein